MLRWRIENGGSNFENYKNGIRHWKPVFGSFGIAEYEYLVKKIQISTFKLMDSKSRIKID